MRPIFHRSYQRFFLVFSCSPFWWTMLFEILTTIWGIVGLEMFSPTKNFNRSRESQAGDFSASCSHFAFAFSTTLISTSVVGFTIHSFGCGHPSANEPDEDSKAVEATEGYHVFCCHSRTESARPPVLGIAQGRDRCKLIFLHGSTAEVPGSPELSLYSEMHCRWIYFAAQHLCTLRSLPNRPADRMPHAR